MARVCICALFFVSMALPALADPIKFIAARSQLDVDGEKIHFSTFIPYSFPYPTEDHHGRLQFARDYFLAHFKITEYELPCLVTLTDLVIDEGVPTTEFKGDFTCPSMIRTLDHITVSSTLFLDLFADVDHFVVISKNGERREVLLSLKNQTSGASTSPASYVVGLFSIIKIFIPLGVEHIFFGFDHILFILAVHLLVRKPKEVLGLVTSFTFAHSLTLVLASYGIVTLTSRIVEPLIALSITYTAIRNITMERAGVKNVLRERWMSTFGFGLVHGLGFAGALAEIKIPSNYFLPSLLSFNVGVEIGQLIIVVLFISTLFLIEKMGWIRPTIYALSGSIGGVSFIWFIQRIFV